MVMPYDEKKLTEHKELMTRGTDIPVTLVTHYGQRAEGHVRHLKVSEQEAQGKALKWLFIWLALTPIVVVFPPHLLWPLVALATAFIGYFARRGRTEVILGGEATCPKCNAFQILDGGNVEWPMAHFCSECRERSLLSPVES